VAKALHGSSQPGGGRATHVINTLGQNLLKQDVQIVRQHLNNGGGISGAQKAIANLEGDYWAVTGQSLPVPASSQNVAPTTSATQTAPAVNVQA